MIGGGLGNTVGGYAATIPGGRGNAASGDYSFAAGRRAKANHTGAFVWADSTDADFASTANNQFLIRAAGGLGVGTPNPQTSLHVAGDFIRVDGLGNEQAYMGGDAFANDVQIGSMNAGVSNVVFYNPTSARNMHVTVATLTITGGADLAEPFDMATDDIAAGAVVVIDEDYPGRLKLSDGAYDTRVAGIVSGANGVSPGVTLRQEGRLEGGKNVALSGRVYALADASNGPIRPGDLLTTSDTPGHAMRAADPAKAQGAIIGKAMTWLKEGKGLVLVLVSLQ